MPCDTCAYIVGEHAVAAQLLRLTVIMLKRSVINPMKVIMAMLTPPIPIVNTNTKNAGDIIHMQIHKCAHGLISNIMMIIMVSGNSMTDSKWSGILSATPLVEERL